MKAFSIASGDVPQMERAGSLPALPLVTDARIEADAARRGWLHALVRRAT